MATTTAQPDVQALGRFLDGPHAEVRDEVRGGVPLPRVFLAWRIPVYGTDEYYALDLASELLAGGKSARLYRELVRGRRLARSVAAFLLPVVTGAAAMIIRGNGSAGEDPAVLERALLDEVARPPTRRRWSGP